MPRTSPTPGKASGQVHLEPRSEPRRRPNHRAKAHTEAIRLLDSQPRGMTFTELVDALHLVFPARNHKALGNDITSIDRKFPHIVCKPTKGLYLHLRHQEAWGSSVGTEASTRAPASRVNDPKVPEEKFYLPFANWLKDDRQEVTHAIALGGNTFRDRWGTPDILGKYEGRRSDVIKGMTTITSAELKVDTANLLTGFGQACAYRLFSHMSYLVIPQHTPADELDRLEALCHMHGIGLVVFDAFNLTKPNFRQLVRPTKHEPELSYTNRYIRHVEARLFG